MLTLLVSLFVYLFIHSFDIAIGIKESAKVGDQAQRRSAKGIDDLGEINYEDSKKESKKS